MPTATPDLPEPPPPVQLWSPQELVAAYAADYPALTRSRIGDLVRAGVVECHRGRRRQVKFSHAQVKALLAAVAPQVERATTPRARLRQRADVPLVCL